MMRYVFLIGVLTACSTSPIDPIFRPLPKETEWVCPQASDPRAIKIAFYNILAKHVSDSGRKESKYLWKNRKMALMRLIQEDHPHVLGICELELPQARDFKRQCARGKLLEGYHLAAFAAKCDEDLESMMEKDVRNHSAYQEFVGFLYDKQRVKLNDLVRIPLPKVDGQRHDRILVEGHFFDRVTRVHFVCLASHFDHLKAESRELSANIELERIDQLQSKNFPFFSLSDRNWCSKANKKERRRDVLAAARYSERLRDFRDSAEFYGPPGTYPGHTWGSNLPKLVKQGLHRVIQANPIDLCYYSEGIEPLYTYHKSGEFDPATGELLPQDERGNPKERNFASDHYLVGGVFLFSP